MWYVYFLELSNGDIYVGSTDDLRRRLNSHHGGHVVSTRKYLPVALKTYVAVANEATAPRQRYFKSGAGKAFAKKRFLDTPGLAPENRRGFQKKLLRDLPKVDPSGPVR